MKYCSKCGNKNEDEAVFCASCGSPMEQAPAAPQPTPDPFVASAPQQPVYTAPSYDSAYSAPAMATTETKNTSTLWLILNIVATVLCCAGFVPTIIGIILAAMGMGSFNKGDYEDMKKKSKLSMILFIVGAVIGLIGWIVFAIIMIVAASNNY